MAGMPVKAVYATSEWIAGHGEVLKKLAASAVYTVEEQALKQMSALTTPNKAMALLDMPAPNPQLPGKGSLVLALEAIQDPGNMGTIIRIADWFGIREIVCSPDCVDVYNPKTIQATMGSIARVRISEADMQSFLESTELPSYAATLHGQDITGFSRLTEGIILIGNEGRGLSEAVTAAATHQITIPRLGGAESLNAAVATGIICGRLLI